MNKHRQHSTASSRKRQATACCPARLLGRSFGDAWQKQLQSLAEQAVSRWPCPAPAPSLQAAAGVCLRALEWLRAALSGPDSVAVETACLPETAEELQRHQRLLLRHGVVLGAGVSEARYGARWLLPCASLKCWIPCIMEPARSSGHSRKKFDFDAIVWSGQADANVCARSQTRLTDADERAAAALAKSSWVPGAPSQVFQEALGCVRAAGSNQQRHTCCSGRWGCGPPMCFDRNGQLQSESPWRSG